MLNNSTSIYDLFDDDSLRYSEYIYPRVLVLLSVLWVIAVLGLIGNGLIIGAVLRYKSMRSVPNILIVNLAVGDILFHLTQIAEPFLTPMPYIRQNSLGKLVICKIGTSMPLLSIGVSIFTMTALSIERVLVISQSFKLTQKASTRITVMIVTIWILAISMAIPDAVSYTWWIASNDNAYYICGRENPSSRIDSSYIKIIYMTRAVAFFFIPLIIITVCYGIMARIMVKSARGIPGESADCIARRVKQLKERRKVANIVIVMVVLFFICWLPYNGFRLYLVYVDSEFTKTMYCLGAVAGLLGVASGSVNPIALYFLSKSFKTHFKKELCCRRNVS